jgi:hypothetical protein
MLILAQEKHGGGTVSSGHEPWALTAASVPSPKFGDKFSGARRPTGKA